MLAMWIIIITIALLVILVSTYACMRSASLADEYSSLLKQEEKIDEVEE